MNRKLNLIISIITLTFALSATAQNSSLKLPQLFQSGMVLQRSQTVPVWGKANPGETVTLKFRNKTYTATASESGKWKIELPAMKAGGPFTMQINDLTLEDVMVGDVWMVSGQSNIDTHIERVYPVYANYVDTYTNDKIRVFQVQTDYSTERKDDILRTSWKYLNKQNCWHFSAIGYFLGIKMYEETGVPQGVIQSSLGGSPIQAWVDLDSLTTDNVRKSGNQALISSDYYTQYQLLTDKEYVAAQARANQRAGAVWNNVMNQNDPGVGKYESPLFDDSSWTEYNQYDRGWALHNGRPITGSIWLRQHINIDAKHAGKPARLNLGTFHDMDYTYVNGKQVGTTGYQYPPRRYDIPAGLLHEGDNVITIRLINKYGVAHFYTDKPHELVFDDGKQEISLNWRTHEGAIMSMGVQGGKEDTKNQASMLYNAMIHPLAPYAMNGIVWYQGESNTGKPAEYGTLLKMMMGNWRTLWGRDNLPFNIVQLANHMEPTTLPTESGWATLREEQRLVAKNDPFANLTVAIDLGEASDIHPLCKRDFAERCALGLDNLLNRAKNALSAEPVEAHIADGNIVIAMSQIMQPNDELCELECTDKQGRFRNVEGKCDGKNVIIALPQDVNTNALTVRYAWKNNPVKANLRGKQGLPASPFQIKVQP